MSTPYRERDAVTRAATYVTTGHTPVQLLDSSRSFIAATIARARAGFIHTTADGRTVEIGPDDRVSVGYVVVATARGGREFRPFGRFAALPVNPRYFSLRPTVKPVYDEITDGADQPYDINAAAGSAETAVPSPRLDPVPPAAPPVIPVPAAPPAAVEHPPVADAYGPFPAPAAGPFYKRAVIDGRKRYVELASAEPFDGPTYTRTGTGKSTRYVETPRPSLATA